MRSHTPIRRERHPVRVTDFKLTNDPAAIASAAGRRRSDGRHEQCSSGLLGKDHDVVIVCRMPKAQSPAAKNKDAPPRVASRRLTPKGEATRARLIELAAHIFAEEGYAAASIRDIAHRSGLSSGAIYGTFRGKADLLAEVVDATVASDVETLPIAVLALTLPEIDRVPIRARRRTRPTALAAARSRGSRVVPMRTSASGCAKRLYHASIWLPRLMRSGAIARASTPPSTCVRW